MVYLIHVVYHGIPNVIKPIVWSSWGATPVAIAPGRTVAWRWAKWFSWDPGAQGPRGQQMMKCFHVDMKRKYGSVSKPCIPVVHIKIAGKLMFIPLKMVLIGIDPYPYMKRKYIMCVWDCFAIPIGSMYGIYAYIWDILMVNVTIYTIHGSYGICWYPSFSSFTRSSRFLLFRVCKPSLIVDRLQAPSHGSAQGLPWP